MADRVVQTGTDEAGDWYLWDCGINGQFIAHVNRYTGEWVRKRLPNPAAEYDDAVFTRNLAPMPAEPNRELAPEVSDD